MKPVINYYILLFGILLLSCSKTKVDPLRNGQIPSNNIPASSARLVLVGGFDLMVNGKKLTNWLVGDAHGGGPEVPPNPTPYFPTTGKLGSTYFIPQEFMNGSGKATVGLYGGGGSSTSTTTEVIDNYTQPWDYYFNVQDNMQVSSLTPIPRPIAKPSSPQNILIRLINLSSSAVVNSGIDEKLSLAYADGSPVSTSTSGIGKGIWSEYVEMPYGTYQFRVMIDGGVKQVPALPPTLGQVTSATDFTLSGTKQYYTQRRLFQPGGVYTIVVTFNEGKYEVDQAAVKARVNAFSTVSDLSPAANLSYARVQVANAVAENGLKVTIDANTPTPVAYTKASDYKILTAGKHLIRVEDASGALKAEKEVQLKGGDNFTVWAFPKADNTIALIVLQNNMSGIINNAEHADGSDGNTSVGDPVSQIGLVKQMRFLNLCPDLPYVTFTAKNGGSFTGGNNGYPAAAMNLPYGQQLNPVAVPFPYLFIDNPYIEAYRSQPASVPGNRLYEVLPLTAGSFINMPESFYPNGLPNGEPGIYTVALIGRNATSKNAKLIVIKHNK